MNADTAQDMPFIPAPRITTVADYLLTRLAEAGVRSVFGVPGDYNLPILDAIAARPDLASTGMVTEQGAGYAADSYARLRGLGALVTTSGVGELSAVAPAAAALTLRARGSHDLARALAAADYHTAAGRPVLIQAALRADDAPPLLRDLSRALADR